MTWSLYKDTGRDYKEWEPNYAAWFVCEDTNTSMITNKIKFLHDGPHEIYFQGAKFPVEISVVNGQWEAQAEEKILAMTFAYYHGTFIEGFYRKDGKLYVIMGS